MRERGLEKREEPRLERGALVKFTCGKPKLRGSPLFDTEPKPVFNMIEVFGSPNTERSWARKSSWKRLKPKRASLTVLPETTLTRLMETTWTSVGTKVFVFGILLPPAAPSGTLCSLRP